MTCNPFASFGSTVFGGKTPKFIKNGSPLFENSWGMLFGSWAIYNAYIRVARASGKLLDVVIWIIAAALTGSYTFWAWTILDRNRFFMSKFFYRGDAPVEYAWSARSKQVRKAWEKARKAGYLNPDAVIS